MFWLCLNWMPARQDCVLLFQSVQTMRPWSFSGSQRIGVLISIRDSIPVMRMSLNSMQAPVMLRLTRVAVW